MKINNQIPEELRQMNNWVLWRYETGASGRPTKVPYMPPGTNAKTDQPRTWRTFDEVLDTFIDPVPGTQPFDGIGFCVPLDGPVHYWGLDFDDAIDPETHEFREWRLENGELAPIQPKDGLEFGSYMETTPSGAGYRVIIKSSLPVPKGKKQEFGNRNPKTDKVPGIEMYSSGRFFAFTGDMLPDSLVTVEERTEEALAFHEKIFGNTLTELEKLAIDLVEGHTGSRNNLMFGISGFLVTSGWKQAKIAALLQYMIAMFHNDDSSFDEAVTTEKQLKELDRLFDRATAKEVIPGLPYLTDLVTPEVLQMLRDFKAPKAAKAKQTVAEILEIIRNHPPEWFPPEEITYLIEPEIPKGFLVLVTGVPGSGKSTLVLHWCIQMAKAGNEVLYLDRDNNKAIVQDRMKRFGGTTDKNFSYWGNWHQDDNGDRLEPPHPSDEFLKEAVRQMKNPVLVFDTFATFSNGDENDNALVSATFKHLRQLTHLGATVIIIHHPGKNANSNSRGASAMEGAIDVGLKIVGTAVEGGTKLTRIDVKFYKSKIGDGEPIHYAMMDGVPVRRTSSLTDKLLALVKQHPGLTKKKLTRQKNSWVCSGSGSFASE